MKLVTFKTPKGKIRAGWLTNDGVVDMNSVNKKLPKDMRSFIEKYDHYRTILEALNWQNITPHYHISVVKLLAPLPNPNSFRDFIAFEKHLQNATARFGDAVPKEWYEIPIFYFSNHHSFVGNDAEIVRPKKCQKLDYELEIACVIGKTGKNIKAVEAESYILGYTILNDWTARDLQAQEMKCMLGPAKGKDFATSMGSFIATKDEIEAYRMEDNRFDMTMKATINGKVTSEGNFKDIYYTFGQMIERASEDVMLYAGDVIGSGTVGWGCLMESGASVHRWLEPNDVVELSITGLGSLKNKIAEYHS